MLKTDKIWMNGELVDWDDARIHVASHGLHYGSGVFEGIRCYETPRGPAIFRLREHLERFEDSARILYMDLPFGRDELRAATHELVARNGLASCYLRPMAFYGYGELSVGAQGNPVDVVILSFPWGAYLGEEGQRTGITTKISSWERIGPNVIPHAAKATGVYLNSLLATTEARRAGYDEAIMLNAEGYVADEVFLCGTATEVAPVRAVDDRELGVGPVTRELQKAYLAAVNGIDERWSHWLDVVDAVHAPA